MTGSSARTLTLVGLAVGLLLAAVPSVAAHPLAAPTVPTSAAAVPAQAASIHFTIPIGKEADGLAYDPTTFDVYIANQGSNNVSVISSVGHTHSSIAVGKSPYGVTFDPYNKKLYAPNYNSSNVTIISASTNKVVANPSLGAHAKPIGSIFDPASGNVLVLNTSGGATTGVGWMITNATNAVKKITFGLGTLDSIGYNPKSKDLYLPNLYSGTVSAISGTGTVSSVTVGGYPEYTFVNPANNDTYVAELTGGTSSHLRIGVISSANKVTANITFSTVQAGFFNGFSYDPATKNTYLVGYNYTTNKSYAFVVSSSNVVSSTVSLGKGEFTIASYDPGNSDVYVTSVERTIAVISGTTVIKSLKVSQYVAYLLYDPTLKDMVGAGDVNATTVSTLNLITTTNSLSTLKVGKLAVAAFYDPKDTYVYVVNIGSKTVELVG
jgi:YVTN family beta-propeller protein